MGCILLLFALLSPRLALVAIWLFSNLLDRAFDSWFVPLLGFLLLPWTTLGYVWMWRSGAAVEGLEWLLVGLGVLFDLGAYSRSRRN